MACSGTRTRSLSLFGSNQRSPETWWLVFIAVPNYTSYDATKYGAAWAAYDVPRHLYHFSPVSMQWLLKTAGFQLKKEVPMWFDSYYISLLSEKYTGT